MDDSNNELTFVRRKNRQSNYMTYNYPVIKLDVKIGRFSISQMLADILIVDNNDGLMFAFNKKNKTAFLMKDGEKDAFILRRKDQGTLRFTSKDLKQHFVETFELLDSEIKTYVFSVSTDPNERGMYTISSCLNFQ